MTIRVLLVCTGNTCRSQMAQAICTHLVNQSKALIAFDSAGVRANVGDATTAEAITVLSDNDIQWCGTSQPASVALLAQVDEVWVMTEAHLQSIKALCQASDLPFDTQVSLLADDRELVDPLGCGLEAYQTLYTELMQLLPLRIKALLASQRA